MMNILRFGCVVIILILTGLSAAASAQAAATPRRQKSRGAAARLFAYNRAVAFDLREESAKEQNGVSIRDVNYAAHRPEQARIKAYLVSPSGKGPFAGALFFHWYGSPEGNRNKFLKEALTLAQHGVASILIQGSFPWLQPPTDGPSDRQRIIDQTIEVRRALDVLLSQPHVDARRIAFVGHDYGAMYGGIIAGVEKRVKAYVLIAGMGNFGDWSLKYWPETAARGEDAYRQALEEIDPINYVSHAAPAAFFFQFANTDIYIPKPSALAFYNRASKPKQVKWYDAEHELNVEAARDDRRRWLARQLGLNARAMK